MSRCRLSCASPCNCRSSTVLVLRLRQLGVGVPCVVTRPLLEFPCAAHPFGGCCGLAVWPTATPVPSVGCWHGVSHFDQVGDHGVPGLPLGAIVLQRIISDFVFFYFFQRKTQKWVPF